MALMPYTLRFWAAALALALCAGFAWAADVLPIPALTGPVVDQAQALTPTDAAAITQQLAALETRTGAQIAVLLVPSTAPEDIVDYTQRVADQWKLGRAQIGDGVLIVVAVQDRKARIAVAKTLEGAIPDLEARRVIMQAMAPKFQSGNYAGGLQAGIGRLSALIAQEALPAPPSASEGGRGGPEGTSSPWWVPALLVLFVLASILRAVFGRRAGAALTGGAAAVATGIVSGSWALALGAGLLVAVLALVFGAAAILHGLQGRSGRGPVTWGSGGWSGGGSWGGRSGGSWGSGGGGDFGGGGASGNW